MSCRPLDVESFRNRARLPKGITRRKRGGYDESKKVSRTLLVKVIETWISRLVHLRRGSRCEWRVATKDESSRTTDHCFREMSIPTRTVTITESRRIRVEDAPDEGQLPRDGAAGTAELVGDGVGGEPLHAEDGDLAEDIVAQSVEESSIFFGDHGGELGGRLGADSLSQKLVVIAVIGDFRG